MFYKDIKMMNDPQEIERVKLKISIYKSSYNNYFNHFLMSIIILLSNLPFITSHWWNAIAFGLIITSIAYTWTNMFFEITQLKFYTEKLNRILMHDPDEIDRLNMLLKLKIYSKDIENVK